MAGEVPAWAATSYFTKVNAKTNLTREKMKTDKPKWYEYIHDVLQFKDPTPGGWRYVRKDERCPEKGMLEPCDDSVVRTYPLPLDDPLGLQCWTADESAKVDGTKITVFATEDCTGSSSSHLSRPVTCAAALSPMVKRPVGELNLC